MPRHKSNRKSSTVNGSVTDDDWGKLKKEILKLKCLEYHLVSNGKKEVLQNRLVEYFSSGNDSSSSNPTNISNHEVEPVDENNITETNTNNNTNTDNEIENLTLLELLALRSEMSAVK